MFRFNIDKGDMSNKTVTQVSDDVQVVDLLTAQEDLLVAREELNDSMRDLVEIESICANVDEAIRSLKTFGVTVENMSILNKDGALDEVAGLTTKLESLESMTEQALEGIQTKYLAALEDQKISLWEKFLAILKRMWVAIKTFFRNLWLKLKSFFKKDKDWYAKAKAANDRLEKEPELKKTVDDLIKTAEIKDGQVVWNEGLWSKFKGLFKKGKATEALEMIGLEDYVLSMGVDGNFGGKVEGEGSVKGSGFIRFDQVEPLINFVSDGIKKFEADAKKAEVDTAGGPIMYAVSKMRAELAKFNPSKEITHEDIQQFKYKLIGKTYQGMGEVMCHMPEVKESIKRATNGIIEVKKNDFYFTGRTFKLEIEINVKTSEGKLGELGWTRKNILDAYDKITRMYDVLDGANFGETGKLAIEAFEKLKFADDVRSEDIELMRNVIALEVRATRMLGQQYSMLIKMLAKARRFLTLVPERLWINREFDVDVTKKI